MIRNACSALQRTEDLRFSTYRGGCFEPLREFIGAVINRRLPNPFMPDAPRRIASRYLQKLAIRFGETIKAYEERGLDKSNLSASTLVLAGYTPYLKGIDNGQRFEISPDPLLAELQAIVNPGGQEGEQDFSCLKALQPAAVPTCSAA